MTATILSIIAGIVAAVVIYMKQQAAKSTPGAEAKADEQKVNNAIASGNAAVVNDEFNKLLEPPAGNDHGLGNGSPADTGQHQKNHA